MRIALTFFWFSVDKDLVENNTVLRRFSYKISIYGSKNKIFNIAAKYSNLQSAKAKHYQTVYEHYGLFSSRTLKKAG